MIAAVSDTMLVNDTRTNHRWFIDEDNYETKCDPKLHTQFTITRTWNVTETEDETEPNFIHMIHSISSNYKDASQLILDTTFQPTMADFSDTCTGFIGWIDPNSEYESIIRI